MPGMSGTLSFQPEENVDLLSHVMEKLKSYRGTEPRSLSRTFC